MSYMIGMWSFSFILRFFDLQRILTVLAGLATVLMYLFINGSPEHMPWFYSDLGFLLQRDLHLRLLRCLLQTKVASPKLVNLCTYLGGTIGNNADLRGDWSDCIASVCWQSAAHR